MCQRSANPCRPRIFPAFLAAPSQGQNAIRCDQTVFELRWPDSVQGFMTLALLAMANHRSLSYAAVYFVTFEMTIPI
jgi:hypothetical protein